MTCNHYHESEPSGYEAKLNWLKKMSKRYKQIKCPKCGLFVIFKKKGKSCK